jgi:hypothetical protein
MFADKSTRSSLLSAMTAAAMLLLASPPAPGQTPEHVAEAKAALDKAPIRAGTCAPATEALQGWPADVLQRCEYKQGDLTGVAYVLDVKPEAMARWIETSCKSLMVGIDSCFERMTKCLGVKSGASFIVGGNGVNERQGAVQNVFYRNGVAFSAKPGAVSIEEQEQLSRTPEAAVTTMLGGGGVSFWHTLPYQFAVKAQELGVPAEMNAPDRRLRWLEVIRTEMLASLDKPENRFLAGWMAAHPITLRTGECADDRDP